MTFFRETDIDRLIARAGGVDVTIGAVTAKGIVDVADESVLQGQAADFLGQVVSIRVRTGVFPGLVEGAAVVADGVNYRVMQSQQIDDGALTMIHAART